MSIARRHVLAASAASLLSGLPAFEARARVEPVWPQFKGDPRRTGRSRFVGPANPQRRWKSPRRMTVQSPMSVGADGSIYVAGDAGILFVLAATGEQRWSRRLHGGYSTAGTALLHDGNVLSVVESGLALCHAPSGIELWRFDLRDYAGSDSSPLVAGDGMIYLGNLLGLHALRPDGSARWHLGEIVSGPPAEGPDGTLYFPSTSRLIAVSPAGQVLWRCESGLSYGLGSAPAVAEDGTIYVTGIRGQLMAVAPNGTIRWFAGSQGLVCDVPSSPAIATDGTICFGSSYTTFNAVHPDGTLRWRRQTVEGDSFSAPTIGADGTIYFGAATGKVHALSPQGEPIWERFFGDADPFYYVRSAPIPMRGGRLLVGAFDGLFAVADQ